MCRFTLALSAFVLLALAHTTLATQVNHSDDDLLQEADRIVNRAHEQIPILAELNNIREEHDFDQHNHEQAVLDEQVAEANVQAMNLMETDSEASPSKTTDTNTATSDTSNSASKGATKPAIIEPDFSSKSSSSVSSARVSSASPVHPVSTVDSSRSFSPSGSKSSRLSQPWVVDNQDQYAAAHVHYHYPHSHADRYHVASHPSQEISIRQRTLIHPSAGPGSVYHHHHHHFHRVSPDVERRLIRSARETLSKLDRKYVQLKHALNALNLARNHIHHEIRRYQARRVWRRREAERWRKIKEREEDSVEAEEERRRRWRHELEVRREEIQMDRWYRHHKQALNSRYLHHHHHHHYANGKRVLSHSSPFRYEKDDKLYEAYTADGDKPAASNKLNRLISKIKKAVISSLPKASTDSSSSTKSSSATKSSSNSAGQSVSSASKSIAAIGKKASFRAIQKSESDAQAQAQAQAEQHASADQQLQSEAEQMDLNELNEQEAARAKAEYNNIMAEHKVAHNIKNGVEYLD